MITIEDIKAAGTVPESFYNIVPGKAIFYVPEDGVSDRTRDLVLELYRQCRAQHEGFKLLIEVETTCNRLLGNMLVARRLNLGSMCCYNLLAARVNSKESVNAFVKEFFDLASRDDKALKWIDKKPVRRHRELCEESPFVPTGMMQMIVMRPTPAIADDDDETEEMVIEKTPEQIERDNKLIKAILDYSYTNHEEMALDFLERLAPRIYTHGECKLVFTEDYEFWLKAGTSVKLNLTKREAALYLFLLAHPKGIEKKRIVDYKEEITDYYFILHKKPNGNKVDKTIDNLVAFKETRDGYKLKALDECTSRINAELDNCIMNRTSQLPFLVQNTDGVLHIDLPRKLFEWQMKEVKFMVHPTNT